MHRFILCTSLRLWRKCRDILIQTLSKEKHSTSVASHRISMYNSSASSDYMMSWDQRNIHFSPMRKKDVCLGIFGLIISIFLHVEKKTAFVIKYICVCCHHHMFFISCWGTHRRSYLFEFLTFNTSWNQLHKHKLTFHATSLNSFVFIWIPAFQ